MAEHKHAAVLRAIADGVPIDEFEARNVNYKSFMELRECFATDKVDNCPADGWITHPHKWEIRRKPQYITVNTFKVPKPLDVMPAFGYVYFPDISKQDMFDYCGAYADFAIRCLGRGILHHEPEAAIAHAKAMLGIDPEAQ